MRPSGRWSSIVLVTGRGILINNIKSYFIIVIIIISSKNLAIARNPPHLYPPWYTLLIHTLLGMVSLFILHYRRTVLVGCCVCQIISAVHWIISVVILIITQTMRRHIQYALIPARPLVVVVVVVHHLCRPSPTPIWLSCITNYHHHHHRLPRNHSSHGFFSKPSAYDIAHDVWMKRRQGD